MSRIFLFADEAGDFEFSRNGRASKYFILTTVLMRDCEIGNALVKLRRDLAWEDQPIGDYFHASTDKQAVRDAVFAEICKHDFHIQATIMEKSKAQPHIRTSRPKFYKYGWFYHFRHGTPSIVRDADEMMIVTAALGTSKERASFENAVNDVLRQTIPRLKYNANFCPSAADPCLSVADYCAWAIQRKWESRQNKDVRSYDLISSRITYEYDLWSHGTKHHY